MIPRPAHVHRRLLRSSRWRVALLGALVVTGVLAGLSTGAYFVMMGTLYAHLGERLERAAAHLSGTGGRAAYLAVDERGRPLPWALRPDEVPDAREGFQVIHDPDLGTLAVLTLPSASGATRVLATPAQEETRALSELLRVLVALTLTGGLVALPAGYALAGLALRPLDEAVRERTEFVALASHQLRTPLTVIRTSAELAEAAQGLTPGEALQRILAQTRRMEALAARLTALARAEAGSTPGPARVDLADAARETVAALGDLAGHRGVAVSADVKPAWAAVDPDEAADMLVAVVENAIQFSPPGGAVSVRVRAQAGLAVAAVTDAGPGIMPQDLPLVTKPFYQGRHARGESGLGLAIARAVADRRGGRLEITSTPGRGTTVVMSLPAARPPSGAAAS